jgi:molybdopterin synthase sulfur carrier subunit
MTAQKDLTMTMTLNILYFASLADEAGCDQETVTVTPPITLPELFAQLNEKHNFSRPQSQLRVALNDNFANWEVRLCDGDKIAFIPPVAGG